MAARHQRKHERSHPAVFPQRHGLRFGAPERRPRGGATVELAAPENPRLLHAIRAILFTHYRSESCIGNLNPASAAQQNSRVSPCFAPTACSASGEAPAPKPVLTAGPNSKIPARTALLPAWFLIQTFLPKYQGFSWVV